MSEFVQMFKDVRNQCFRISLSNEQLVELAFQGLLPIIKEKFSSQEFESLGQQVHRISAHESRFQEF